MSIFAYAEAAHAAKKEAKKASESNPVSRTETPPKWVNSIRSVLFEKSTGVFQLILKLKRLRR